MNHKVFLIALVLFAGFAVPGCKKDKDSGTLQLHLREANGSLDLSFDKLIYASEAGHTYSVVTLRYYLSRILLGGAVPGTLYDLADVVYRDARDPETALLTVPDIPNGSYTGLTFIFGLDDVMNVDGGLPNTVENINMEWPIPGDQGYHYMKFEGKYDVYDSGTINSYNLHLGATGGNQNFFAVTLPLSLVIDGNDWMVELTMDVNEWLQNPNTYDFETFGPAIMMNQTAQETLRENGATIFSVTAVEPSN
jgi:hypothetical protein